MPGDYCLTTSFDPQLICDQGSKTFLPVSNRLIGKDKASLSKHLSYITETQCIAQPPQNNEQDDIRREFQGVERYDLCAKVVFEF